MLNQYVENDCGVYLLMQKGNDRQSKYETINVEMLYNNYIP